MTDRFYLNLIHQAAKSCGVEIETITPDFIYKFNHDLKSFTTFDTDIGLNNSASSKIAQSKTCTFEVLNYSTVPSIEHILLKNPKNRFSTGNIVEIAKNYFKSNNNVLVVKPDNGSQGNHVYKVSNENDFFSKLEFLFSLEYDVALSPYLNSTLEYRIVTLNKQPKLFISKERTTSWKHNLVSGAISKEVVESKIHPLSIIAKAASEALNLDFCSVDILETVEGYKVIEVNDKVMLDEYVRQNKDERYPKVFSLYTEAIKMRLNIY